MKKMLIVSTALSMLILTGVAGSTLHLTASANSAPPYWHGTTGAGVIVTGEQCPVEVEREILTLNIPELPRSFYLSQEEFEEYSASVTAEYTFYNPTDMEVEMELAFPFGIRPEYSFAGYDSETDESGYFDDTARYEITAGGEAVPRELRYTYRRSAFTVSSMYSILDEKKEVAFFSPESLVTKYEFTVAFPQKKNSGVAEFELKYNPSRTKILCSHFRAEEVLDGKLHLYLYADQESNSLLTFTAVGEAPEILSTAVREDGFSWESENWKKIEGASVNEKRVTETTFEEYVESARPAGIGEVDFYNGFVDCLMEYAGSSYSYAIGFMSIEADWLSIGDFMRWYTYTLKIPAGERLTNAVTAPLYPTIDNHTCKYEYLLSPAQKWADFGTLDIVINTEFEIGDASPYFQKTESGYILHYEGLPLGELTFTIAGDYEYPITSWGIAVIVIMVVICVVVLAAIIGGIVYVVKWAKKRKRNK